MTTNTSTMAQGSHQNKPTQTFEEWNVPTEEKQWKVGALIEFEKIANKAATARIIAAFKAAIFEETDEPCYCEYCPACEAGECYGHTYDKYCHLDEDETPIQYEGNYPSGDH